MSFFKFHSLVKFMFYFAEMRSQRFCWHWFSRFSHWNPFSNSSYMWTIYTTKLILGLKIINQQKIEESNTWNSNRLNTLQRAKYWTEMLQSIPSLLFQQYVKPWYSGSLKLYQFYLKLYWFVEKLRKADLKFGVGIAQIVQQPPHPA